jgi:hypothetical protein
MEALHAFEYAMGIYGLSLLVTLFVWLVIVVIRWLSSEPAGPKSPSVKRN